MRYVIVDLQGASRDYFGSRVSAREAIREIEDEAPGSAAEFYVVAYDDAGRQVGEPERGDELLSGPPLDWADVPVRLVTGGVLVSGASSTTAPQPRPVPTRQYAGGRR